MITPTTNQIAAFRDAGYPHTAAALEQIAKLAHERTEAAALRLSVEDYRAFQTDMQEIADEEARAYHRQYAEVQSAEAAERETYPEAPQ